MARERVTYSWDGIIKRTLIAETEYSGVQKTEVVLPDSFFERNRALEEDQTGAFKLIARVPMTVYEQAVHEGWADDQQAWARWLNNPDNAAFRVWRGRV